MNKPVLNQRWEQIFDGYDEAVVAHEFDQIIKRYGETHRHYHSIEHISACLTHFDSVTDRLDDSAVVELAIWFHDIIYKPLNKLNELESAQYARAALGLLGVPDSTIDAVERLILLTQHPSIPECNDEKYLLDIDLTILGATPEVYMKYEVWIRQEYSSVPKLIYGWNRKKLLQCFLNKNQIYSTAFFSDKFEAQARENLTWAIDNL